MSKYFGVVIAFLVLAVGFHAPNHAKADQITITIPHNIALLPDTPGQTVDIFAVGDLSMSGLNLLAQIGDGAGGNPEPLFTQIDFGNHIWQGPNGITMTPASPDDYILLANPGQYIQRSVAINGADNFVTVNGKIATVTIDTTGFFAGTFELKLSIDDVGESAFIVSDDQTYVPTINNGSITIVPEPSSLAFASALLGAAVLGRLRRRRKSLAIRRPREF